MAQIVLVLGESGTGKSTSMRNFKEGEVALVNVAQKPLPFRAKFESISGTDYKSIEKFMKTTEANVIVVDDCQYIMSFQYMRRIKENGWDKFNEIQSDFFNLIELAKSLPENKIVFFLSHLETKEDGRQKIKTIGKMLDEKITIEGMFTVVLKTYVSDGNYFFLTQNSGMDTVKSPMGMFPSMTIDNDLKYVEEKIRNYYYMDGAKTDEEIAAEDDVKKIDIIPGEKKLRRTRNRVDDGRTAEEVEKSNQEKIANAGIEDAKGKESVPFEDVREPQLEVPPRRQRKARPEAEEEQAVQEPEQTSEAPRRRRRIARGE